MKTNRPEPQTDPSPATASSAETPARASREHPVSQPALGRRRWIAPTLLLGALVVSGFGLAAWKMAALEQAEAIAAGQPEPMESVTMARAQEREHRPSSTTIGTVVALRSVSLRNELAGTVREVQLEPGAVVEPGTLLVALDVSVEQAELKALQAQAALAETLLKRMEQAVKSRAYSLMELDRSRSELDVANAQIARTEAVIARKTIRAPFRARVGISDVHPGQYLNEGTRLTTLQGVSDAAHVDFSVSQEVAHWLREGTPVEISPGSGREVVVAEVLALDSKVDPATRNIMVRARVSDASTIPAPGASVRVRVPAGNALQAVSVPVSALRKGPAGDHVFVIAPGPDGQSRAQLRHVQAGAALGDEVLILSGLSVGDPVAALGSFKLRDQALVAVAGENPAGQSMN